MTSANVTEFIIKLNGKEVGRHRQHHFCKTRWNELLKFDPVDDYTITPTGEDEEEEVWEGDTVPLRQFLESKRVVIERSRSTGVEEGK